MIARPIPEGAGGGKYMSATTLQELQVDVVTRDHLTKGLSKLEDEFAGIFSRETVERFMAESLEALKDSRLKDFVPLFVHRFARERLRALGQVEGTITKTVPEVLFVCVHNAGRSQMAASLLTARARGRVHVRSAGSDPAEAINPAVVEAMQELGIDVSEEFPKPLADTQASRDELFGEPRASGPAGARPVSKRSGLSRLALGTRRGR